LESEFAWFQNLPSRLKVYTPSVIGNANGGYAIEYLNHLTLSEIYQFGKLPNWSWEEILGSCFEFLEVARSFTMRDDSKWDVAIKTKERLAILSKDILLDFEQILDAYGYSFDTLIQSSNIQLQQLNSEKCIVHGDFCFSNIFYDFRSKRIIVIDPRGSDFVGNTSSYGDALYDIAKLGHSCIGRYDEIVSGDFEIVFRKDGTESIKFFDSEKNLKIANIFIRMVQQQGFEIKVIYEYMVHLFLSMIPLHDENIERQRAFLLNAIRLRKEMEHV